MKKDLELIAREEFKQRLAKELVKLASEGIGFYLPIVVVDHVADTESNISFVKSKIKKCAKEAVEDDDDDGLNLFKIRRLPVNAMVDGNLIMRMKVLILVQCAFCDAHQAIYRTIKQTVATRLRIGVYVFDNDGCQYADRTMWGEAIDTRLFANNAHVNKLIRQPIFIDKKKDIARKESRNHLSKVQGGYPVARILGTTDIPRYRELQKPPKLSTRDEP